MVLAGPRRDCSDYPSLSMGSENIVESEFVTPLGVELDDRFTLTSHIRNIAKNCFFKLRNMYEIRKCITEDAAKIMVNSMITSKLDYCNAILYGLLQCDLDKLHSVQKLAARLITGIRKYDQITPLLKQLHWLPVKRRIKYKIVLLVFKCLQEAAQEYLSELLERRGNKGTRGDNKNLLVVPRIKRLLKVDMLPHSMHQ